MLQSPAHQPCLTYTHEARHTLNSAGNLLTSRTASWWDTTSHIRRVSRSSHVDLTGSVANLGLLFSDGIIGDRQVSNLCCVVSVTGLNLGRLQYREAITTASRERVKLTGLLPDTYYRIYLFASTVRGKGEPIFLNMKTTPAGSACTAIVTLSIRVIYNRYTFSCHIMSDSVI